jgi:lycopene beta-cyclase
MQKDHDFDYIIIGNGLAGFQLALGFLNDPFFDSKHIALIDPSLKTTNDKTWSFWEQGDGIWDSIVYKNWNKALFKSKNIDLSIPLNGYTYKSIRSIEFYNLVKRQLEVSRNFHFILDEVREIDNADHLTVVGKQNKYSAKHVFDSRIPNEYASKVAKFSLVHQHFKGWVIRTDKPCFQPDEFIMMDYRFNYKDSTSFIYLLPFSETEALIEFTFFTPYLVEDNIYDNTLNKYIKTQLKLDSYEIVETEIGNIPMTDFPFWDYHTKGVTKIGTGGGWVKGSTGYSFKHTEKYVQKIIDNMKAGMTPSSNLIRKKFKFYDAIFLYVLKRHNEKGIWIFEQFYSKNSIGTMFRFLDEETSYTEDIQIMKSLFSMTFIKAFFRVLFRF